MTRACFCGTFDPVTLGHLDVITRASKLFDEIVVFISCNADKKERFSFEQRLAWLQEATSHLNNVRCDIQKGLVVEACHQVQATILVRGIRNMTDFEYERNMAAMNQLIDHNVETVLLMTDPRYMHCSSSNVRELLRYHQDVSALVPACVARDLKREAI